MAFLVDAILNTQPTFMRQPPAWFHTRVLVGPGAFLTPAFVSKHNITAVINCAFPEDSPPWWRTVHPDRYTCLYCIDDVSVDVIWWYPAFAAAMQTYLRDTTGVVYVHCQAGMNRSASLALAYVCKNFGADVLTSITAFQRQRPCMFQNQAFKRQVIDFVNGRVPRPQSAGGERLRRHPWDLRFTAPRGGANPSGFWVAPGRLERRDGDTSNPGVPSSRLE